MNDLSALDCPPESEFVRTAIGDVLGVPGNTAPSERTRLLLQQLDHTDYLPPPAWHDALEIFADPNLELVGEAWLARPALCREFEDRLRFETDHLATRFFDIPPADRLLQWTDLARQSRFSRALRARLALLKPGLALELGSMDAIVGDRTSHLVPWIVEMFPLEAAARARSIGKAIGSMIDDRHDWEATAHRLSQDHPEIAALVPEFLAAVLTLCEHERELEEKLRRAARDCGTAEGTGWESQNLGDYLKWMRGVRADYWIFGIFGGIPLLVVLIAVLIERSAKERLYRINPNDEIINVPRADPTSRIQDSLHKWPFPQPPGSGSDNCE